jgi:hypothetical protein
MVQSKHRGRLFGDNRRGSKSKDLLLDNGDSQSIEGGSLVIRSGMGKNQVACGDPSMQLFFHGTDNSVTVEQNVQAGVGSKNGYLTLELKQGPAT